ncbi:MAG: UbiX family flavin prenyltransferase [Desulfovibrionales bacterium]
MQTPLPRRIVLAVTGASGICYAFRLAQVLAEVAELHLIFSDAAEQVMSLETDLQSTDFSSLAKRAYTQNDLAAPPASGSWIHHGMIVCPCSMASMAAIAGGLGSNLIHRAADVTLKEGRPLILVPRETPLNRIHIQNMLSVVDAGAKILPATPGFYHRPQTIDDLVDHIAGKVLDLLGVEHSLFPRWAENL